MTISLAFLAPDLVKAAIDGRLPHGFGVTRLSDLPAEWSRQRRILGLGAYWSAFEPRLRNRGSPAARDKSAKMAASIQCRSPRNRNQSTSYTTRGHFRTRR